MSEPNTIRKVLIANRGEIALRVIRAARDLGMESCVVFAPEDRGMPFVQEADGAVELAGSGVRTYLDQEKIVAAALESGSDAVHPGYGFLSENAEFAARVTDAGLIWVGPPSAAIAALGDKSRARLRAAQLGVPTLGEASAVVRNEQEVRLRASEVSYPIAIKAVHGGGGRGLRVIHEEKDLISGWRAVVTEAELAFGDGTCFLESYLDHARHVEVQIMIDAHDRVVVVGTRDCTLQRRFQKLVEEAPAPHLSESQEDRLREFASALCGGVGYRGAATVEFLVGPDGGIWFLEVNTRLQVEHTVTEEAYGVDLVCEQFRIAQGRPLDLPDVIPPIRHAVEFRVNAEDVWSGFVPRSGRIHSLAFPGGPGIRYDGGVRAGNEISPHFDSLIGKLVVTGADRRQALARSVRALTECHVQGVDTTLDFHRSILGDPAFTAADPSDFGVHTRWIEEVWAVRSENLRDVNESETATVHMGVRVGEHVFPVILARSMLAQGPSGTADGMADSELATMEVLSTMQGVVSSISVAQGDEVEAGAVLITIEAMKMENAVKAPFAGTVVGFQAVLGASVAEGEVLCVLQRTETPALSLATAAQGPA